MKTLTCLFVAWALQMTALAVEMAELSQQPAVIEVAQMEPIPLGVSDGKKTWSSVPNGLANHGAVIYKPLRDHLGVADITVKQPGYLLLACNYDYQGNDSGDWQKQVWNERRFRNKGWKVIKPSDLGGNLIQSDGRAQVVFYKKVAAGDRLVLRCNKYDPPYPILLK